MNFKYLVVHNGRLYELDCHAYESYTPESFERTIKGKGTYVSFGLGDIFDRKNFEKKWMEQLYLEFSTINPSPEKRLLFSVLTAIGFLDDNYEVVSKIISLRGTSEKWKSYVTLQDFYVIQGGDKEEAILVPLTRKGSSEREYTERASNLVLFRNANRSLAVTKKLIEGFISLSMEIVSMGRGTLTKPVLTRITRKVTEAFFKKLPKKVLGYIILLLK